jgi:manganese/zinc/iron transport system permease protein
MMGSEAQAGISDRNVWIITGIAILILLLSLPLAVLFGVRFTYTLQTVTLGGALLGAVSGIVGSFAVLRKQSLLGDALSHAALPGVGIAFLVAGRQLWALLAGAAIAGLIGVWFINLVTRNTRIKQDTAMGIVLTGWFALGIGILAFIQQRPDASQAGLDSFIFGQAAAMVRSDLYTLAGVGAALIMVIALAWKEFKLITFDPDFAAANGFPIRLITGLLLALLVMTVVLGLQLAGVVLMVGLLIAPGVAARQWTNKLGQMVVLAGVIGAASGGAGAVASALDRDLPTGPLIIVFAALFVLISIFFAPGRGMLWVWNLRRRNRTEHAADNVLKFVIEYGRSHDDPNKPVSWEFLEGVLGSSARRGIRELLLSGRLSADEDGYRLTPGETRDIPEGG